MRTLADPPNPTFPYLIEYSLRLRYPHLPLLWVMLDQQITWLLSIANRMTGVALSGVLYAASIAYLAHPMFPALDSAHLIELAHSMPVWLKGSVKLLFAVPFTFHTFNGIRHLAWDIGYGTLRAFLVNFQANVRIYRIDPQGSLCWWIYCYGFDCGIKFVSRVLHLGHVNTSGMVGGSVVRGWIRILRLPCFRNVRYDADYVSYGYRVVHYRYRLVHYRYRAVHYWYRAL
jgi:succinate dehydrogenase cytochrome b556 subunit